MKFTIGIVLTIALLSLGCTRKANQTSVRLVIPTGALSHSQSLTQSTDEVIKISINISGGGTPLFWTWENCRCASIAGSTPPSQVTLAVEAGAARLVQVLIVKRNEDTDAISLSYGEQNADIRSGDNTVNVSVLPTSSNETAAEVFAKYVDSASGTGPSGTLLMKYTPASGKSMTVDEIGMIGGFTRMHVLTDTGLDYVFKETGQVLFSNLKISNIDSFIGNQFMKVAHPAFYRATQYSNGTPSVFSQQAEGVFYFGFIGPYASGRYACYSLSDSVPLTKAWSDQGSTLLNWSGTTPTATHLRRVAGGSNQIGTPCTTGTKWVTTWNFDHYAFGEGNDQMGGYRGAFELFPSARGKNPAQALFQKRLGATQINWKLLPSTEAPNGPITTVRVYKKTVTTYNDSSLEDGDGIRCQQLASLGFSLVADVPVSTSGVLLTSVSENAMDLVALCPMDSSGTLLNKYGAMLYNPHAPAPTFGSGNDGNYTSTSSIANVNTFQAVGGKKMAVDRRVSSIAADGKTLVLAGGALNSPDTEYSVGDEIAWMVVAANSSTSCGGGLLPGEWGFNFIDSLTAASATIVLRAPLSLTASSVNASALTATAPFLNSNNFCVLKVQRVPHFKNLTIDHTTAAVAWTLATMSDTTFLGGTFFLRVKDSLTSSGGNSAIINGNYAGFPGGLSSPGPTGRSGHGIYGQVENAASAPGQGGAGQNSKGGGGGSHVGPGGNGAGSGGSSSGSVPGVIYSVLCSTLSLCGSDYPLFTTGGGGGASNEADGGSGGGLIYLAARSIAGSDPLNIYVSGDNGYGGTSMTKSGGAGAGGSARVITQTLSTNVIINANGGNGGGLSAGDSAFGGGGGGGGFVEAFKCTGASSFSATANGGSAGYGSTYSGNPGTAATPSVSNGTFAFCSEYN